MKLTKIATYSLGVCLTWWCSRCGWYNVKHTYHEKGYVEVECGKCRKRNRTLVKIQRRPMHPGEEGYAEHSTIIRKKKEAWAKKDTLTESEVTALAAPRPKPNKRRRKK